MSDYDRNVASAPFGQAMGHARPVAVDEGLRAYMLRVYNYMVLGLAITGLAALGIYMLSVTGELAAAAKIVRNGAEIPARIAGNMYLTPLGYYVFVSPIKWVIMLAPLAMVFVLSFGVERMRPATAQIDFLDLRGADGAVAQRDLPGVHPHLDRAGVLHHRGLVRRAQPVGLHHPARPDAAWARSC